MSRKMCRAEGGVAAEGPRPVGGGAEQILIEALRLAGRAFCRVGQTERAELLFQAVRDQEACHSGISGLSLPDVSVAVSNLALFLASEGRWEEAETLSEQAVELAQRSWPPSDPRLARRLESFLAIRARML